MINVMETDQNNGYQKYLWGGRQVEILLSDQVGFIKILTFEKITIQGNKKENIQIIWGRRIP